MEDMTEYSRAHLGTRILGRTIIHRAIADSTNDVARRAALEGAPEGLVVTADQQTAGRGRMGRTWQGEEGSLLMSLLLRPSFHPTRLFALTMLSATATREAIHRATGLNCDLKWPNDLQIRGRKLGGILTEASLHGEGIDFAIVGLGLNVNLDVSRYPEIADTATSLRRALGREIDRGELLCGILEQIETRYEWARRDRLDLIHQEWRSALVNLGQQVRVIDRGQVVEGLAEDVDLDGTLLVRQDDGKRIRVITGDVFFR